MISGKILRDAIISGANNINNQRSRVDELNVFPVPDGDTGTNMSLTIQTAVTELRRVEPSTLEEAAKITASGLLRGARGNSGVITSQILRGVAEGLVSADEPITSANIAFAFRRAVKVAFQAVRKPIEGTILTVLRDVSTKADELSLIHI